MTLAQGVILRKLEELLGIVYIESPQMFPRRLLLYPSLAAISPTQREFILVWEDGSAVVFPKESKPNTEVRSAEEVIAAVTEESRLASLEE